MARVEETSQRLAVAMAAQVETMVAREFGVAWPSHPEAPPALTVTRLETLRRSCALVARRARFGRPLPEAGEAPPPSLEEPPDDTTLAQDAWDAKMEAVLADVARRQAQHYMRDLRAWRDGS